MNIGKKYFILCTRVADLTYYVIFLIYSTFMVIGRTSKG